MLYLFETYRKSFAFWQNSKSSADNSWELIYAQFVNNNLVSSNYHVNLFQANVPFVYSLKRRNTCGFLTFSGGIKMEYWGKMGSIVSFVKLLSVSFCEHEFFKTLLTKHSWNSSPKIDSSGVNQIAVNSNSFLRHS